VLPARGGKQFWKAKFKKLSGKTLDAFCKRYFHHGDSNHIFGSAGQDLEVL
jgi:hypothetical protein